MKPTTLLILISSLVLSTQNSFAEIDPTDRTKENCATTPLQLDATLDEIVGAFGGLQSIEGKWRLGGIMGDIQKVRIRFLASNSGFAVQANKDPLKEAWLCYAENEPTILRIRIVKPFKPENGLILVRPGKAGLSIFVAAAGSNWKFLRFKRDDDGAAQVQ